MAKGNQMSKSEWENKEKRALFCKSVNSILMTTPEKPLKDVLKASKRIIDFAFKHYSDSKNASEDKMDFS